MTGEDGKILKIGSPSQLPFAQGEGTKTAYVLRNGTLALGWPWMGSAVAGWCAFGGVQERADATNERREEREGRWFAVWLKERSR